MDKVNTPAQGLTLDQAMAQLKASRQPAPEQEQLEDESVEVVEEELDEYDSEGELDSEDFDELDEEEDQDADEESEDGDEESEEEEVFEVEIDGEIQEVTAEELRKGYLRHNDYTRKRQADAAKMREFESEYTAKLSKLDQVLQQNVSLEQQQLQQLQQQYKSTTDEQSRRDIHYRMLQLQQRLSNQTAMQKKAQELAQQAQAAEQEAKWKAEQDMLQAMYEDWPTKQKELMSYLTGTGFTEQELAMFAHHKMAEIVDKAKQFDELQSKRKDVVKQKIKRKVPKVLKAGQGEQRFNVNQKQLKELEARFAKSGSIKDAQALMNARKRLNNG